MTDTNPILAAKLKKLLEMYPTPTEVELADGISEALAKLADTLLDAATQTPECDKMLAMLGGSESAFNSLLAFGILTCLQEEWNKVANETQLEFSKRTRLFEQVRLKMKACQ